MPRSAFELLITERAPHIDTPMNSYQKMAAREFLLDHLLLSQPLSKKAAGSQLGDLKQKLRSLAQRYEVVILVPGQYSEQVASLPIQLCVTPPFTIRISGTLRPGAADAQMAFHPNSVTISGTNAAPSSGEFRHEAESAHDVIAHVHHILGTLRQDDLSKVVLSA